MGEDRQYTETTAKHRGCIPAPLWVVEGIEERIGAKFQLDVAADEKNHKAPRYYTKEQDGLVQDWDADFVWCNPPWHKDVLGQWVEKAYRTAKEQGRTVACALPLWSDHKWYLDYAAKAELVVVERGLTVFNGNRVTTGIVLIFRPDPDSRAGRQSVLRKPHSASRNGAERVEKAMHKDFVSQSIGGVTIKFHKGKGPGRRLCPKCQAAGQHYAYVGATYQMCPRCGHQFAAKGKAAPPHEPPFVDQHNAAIAKQMVGGKVSPETKPKEEPRPINPYPERIKLADIFGLPYKAPLDSLGKWLNEFDDFEQAVAEFEELQRRYELMQKHFSE